MHLQNINQIAPFCVLYISFCNQFDLIWLCSCVFWKINEYARLCFGTCALRTSIVFVHVFSTLWMNLLPFSLSVHFQNINIVLTCEILDSCLRYRSISFLWNCKCTFETQVNSSLALPYNFDLAINSCSSMTRNHGLLNSHMHFQT